MLELLALITLDSASNLLIGALGFVVAFGLAVFVHELGHFAAAKFFGVRVERFVIGFDREAMAAMPRCVWERKIGDTTYGLSVVPLGGYVKMVGPVHPDIEKELEGGDWKAPAEDSLAGQAVADHAALYQKPFWQKIIIYGAGVAMNFLLAMALVAFINIRGTWEDRPLPPVVGWIAPDGALAAHNIRRGDRIVSLDGVAVSDSTSYFAEFTREDAWSEERSRALRIELERDGATHTAEFALDKKSERINGELSNLVWRPAHIDRVLPNAPADDAGIRDGDSVARVNGEAVDGWQHFVWWVKRSPKTELDVTLSRGGEELAVKLTPWDSTSDPGEGQAGVVYGNPDKEHVSRPPAEAVAGSPAIVAANIVRYGEALAGLAKKLVTLNVTAVHRDMSGPVGIAQFAGRSAQRGFSDWLEFLVMLNIALGVMNALPIPVLDGGHIVFAAYEAVFKRPLPARIFVRIMEGAVLAFLAFFVVITFSDVFKLF
ncbi:MAG: RIP metalloprotease RseP [Candidatus Sumerlaeia bacterium]|nr:RIP metalloprotease RseP [Candidatus Sumerlaeia bacterium]